MEFISKIVECNGNPTEIIMNKMMKPCSQEELDAMSAQEREGCKYMSPLNTREYVAEEGISLSLIHIEMCIRDSSIMGI